MQQNRKFLNRPRIARLTLRGFVGILCATSQPKGEADISPRRHEGHEENNLSRNRRISRAKHAKLATDRRLKSRLRKEAAP
jgi:hypothetical protein